MLTTVDTLVILAGVGLCWIGTAIALNRIITTIARHARHLRPAITPSSVKERPMYTRNNPFSPIPQRPHRDDPVRDRRNDPTFYAAFGDGEEERN